MAANRRSALNNPPSPSLSDEPKSDEISEEEEDQEPEVAQGGDEEDVGSGEEDEGDDDSGEEDEDDDVSGKEEKRGPLSPSVEQNTSLKKPPVSGSDFGRDSGTDSDTESDGTLPSPTVSDYTVKPIASKSIVDSYSAGFKRAAEPKSNGSVPREKKAKIPNGGIGEQEKKPSSQRIWNEDDEVAVLNGMIEFQSERGINPSDDMSAFHEFIKDSLRCSVSKSQVMDKLRRMKKKYQVNADREDPVFTKPHENTIYELSKKLWNSESGVNGNKVSRKAPAEPEENNCIQLYVQEENVEEDIGEDEEDFEEDEEDVEEDVEEEEEEEEDIQADEDDHVDPKKFWSQYPLLKEWISSTPGAIEGSLAMKALKALGRTKAKEMEEKWSRFRLDEWKLHLEKFDLARKHNEIMVKALDSSET